MTNESKSTVPPLRNNTALIFAPLKYSIHPDPIAVII